jgi:DNA adenine methylase
MVSKLLKLIPPHRVYVEVFGGGASLLLAKPPSEVEVYNDIDSDLVNLFRVLRDKEKFQRFYRLVCLTPYSREEYNFCKHTFKDCQDDVERAYRFFVFARMTFSGYTASRPSWSFVITTSAGGMAQSCSGWLHVIERLPEIHARLANVQIEHCDFRQIIPAYDAPDTFFYCDPPYVPEARRRLQTYRYEMSLDDHRDLVNLLLGVRGKVMLSGYRHEVYEPLERAGWRRVDFSVACCAVGRTRHTKVLGEGSAKRMQPRVESVWMNYEPPEGACSALLPKVLS